MNKRSEQLIRLAKEMTDEWPDRIEYASVSGSAARGDADKYSDLDIHIFGRRFTGEQEQNHLYHGEIVQVHAGLLPNRGQIIRSPWEERAWAELMIIKDRDNRLGKIKKDALNYFFSSAGRKKILGQVAQIVDQRIHFAYSCLGKKQWFSATHAAMGAWSEAAFCRMFLKTHQLSTGQLIPFYRREGLYQEFLDCSIINGLRYENLSSVLCKLRNYLKDKGSLSPFNKDPLQHELCKRKNERFVNKGDFVNLQWQMYGEALWLFFDSAGKENFEMFHQKLPDSLKHELRKVGFVPLDRSRVELLCGLSRKLLTL
ncbi:nucleotidyltransferase domain-containing protein [Sporolactobacillus shoreicorticis]|uniref:Nucleotidyltransferase domain-containing protein n=1 Tax=Sporolactobacillus shoreicorticis TaxID=1923877 RepID=A0ABW5S0K3_9BACL|nr:nucleotidyltransferase domain-containing protein [Sporolactobacillus shoreicorticis]MCO7124541.1 nucleotidyltransferase domain-containing protein [Sporolactobacillus shoreicorticis]